MFINIFKKLFLWYRTVRYRFNKIMVPILSQINLVRTGVLISP